MAWQSGGFTFRLQLVDAGANEVSKSFELVATLHATVVTDVAIILAAFEAVSALGSKTYTVSESFYNDAFALPAEGVQAEAKAVLIGPDGTLPNKRHRTEIPGPETDVFLATTGEGANIVDITHQDVLDYWNLFDSAGEATLSDGESVATDGLEKGYRRTTAKKHG